MLLGLVVACLFVVDDELLLVVQLLAMALRKLLKTAIGLGVVVHILHNQLVYEHLVSR